MTWISQDGRTVQISATISKADAHWISGHADSHGIPRAEVLRKAIKMYRDYFVAKEQGDTDEE